ncbi:MAG: transcriptional regulator [Calditrichaeota bacterium]|nr:MAG: transcriptional regulator [Calditrichota bacterium]MBL1205978.1 transcriptional regulator [Calditrichota bacterium]NOG45806.1 transcriptional regulator [Calditrichota bacterium]
MIENQNVEWKKIWKDEYLKWICGFANASGGKIFIGKDDTGRVTGIKDSQKLLNDIPNKITNHLGVLCDVNLHEEKKKHFIEIVVHPYDVPISYHGAYYYRSGSTKQELKGAPLNEFLLRKAGKTWDDVIEPNATFEDIDENAVVAFKKIAGKSNRLPQVENEKDIKQIFENLRLLEKGKLKRAAILLFGKDPRKFFINAFIKVGKFGQTDDDLLSQEVIEGNAFELATQTLEILDKKYFKKSISYDGLHRVDTTEYPYGAVREILLNAIVHREYFGAPIQISIYEDKFMVWNYGKLPDSISLEDLGKKHSSHPRNPILADILFKAGLIESWGRGTLKVIAECKAVGMPSPEIDEINGGLIFTIHKDISSKKYSTQFSLNERQLKTMIFLKEYGKITNKKYQELHNISKATATRDLSELVDKYDLLEKKGVTGVGTEYKLKGS